MERETGGDSLTSAVHQDILQTHILTRLDGPTLASAACASSQLHALSTDEDLWREICHHTWPSTADPRLRCLISEFPAGHRSFYSDSFPTLDHRRRPPPHRRRAPAPENLISAVDIRYKNMSIISKVHETETGSGLSCPFRIDILDPKETVSMPVKLDIRDDTCQPDLEENLTLSWILVDPTRTRAANLSCPRPVSADRNWLTGDMELRFATLLAGEKRGEWVQCIALVTCGGREGGGLLVKEVSLHVEDIEGKNLGWKESLVILQEAMESGKRRKGKMGEERERYEEWMGMKRERRERKKRREMRLELACIATGVAVFIAFWLFVAFKFLQLLRLC